MTRRALITWGGWDGHQPDLVADLCRHILVDDGMQVDVVDTLACFDDADAVRAYDLIVPVWTMSTITKQQCENVSEAVAHGTGLAGCHGGMCDAFRDQVLWQFMTGANWVAHPGGDGVDYRVNITDPDHELVQGIDDFDVSSEQYYLHVDPVNHVLATTQVPAIKWYNATNPPAAMPVAWTRSWGLGRVYYNALGHQAHVIDHGPAFEMLKRGLIWASHSQANTVGDLAEFSAPGNHY
jgi:type 1 glutamine amidotransferase